MSERLETRLAALRDELDWPATPDLASRVASRLDVPRRARPLRGQRLRVAVALGLVALLVATGVGAAVSSDVRAAIKRILGISGAVRIERVDRLPDFSPARDLGLGERTTLTRAVRGSDFRVGYPRALGAPDAVYRSSAAPGGIVSLVYLAREGLPASTGRVGLLLMALEGRGDNAFSKLVQGGVGVELVDVNGARGYWIGGAHALLFEDREGTVREERPRLAGRTLVWTTAGGVTYRLESRLGMRAALRVARTVR
jgi:hypothetical protein